MGSWFDRPQLRASISRAESDGLGGIRNILQRVMVICPTTHAYSNAHVGYFTHTHIHLRKEDAI